MRDLKFRAWRTGKKMLYRELCDRNWYTEDGKQICSAVPEDKHWFKIMQYTGLKDKNGVEIYEGDIVDWPLDHGSLAVIEYRGSMFGGAWKPEEFWTPLDVFQNLEVIGNIYENPELLK